MFDGHIPAKFRDRAPKVVTKDDGTDAWVFEGQEATNVGLNAVAGRPPDEYGVEPTRFSEMRPGCFDIHERIRDMNAGGVLASMNFPSYPQFCGQYFARAAGQGSGARRAAGLQRLARRRLVWCVPGSDDAAGHPTDLGRAGDGRRGPADVGQGLSCGDVLGKPGETRLPVVPQRSLGSVLEGVQRREHRRLSAHRLLVPGDDHFARGTDRHDDHAAADEHRAGRCRPALVTGAKEVPDS